MTTIKSSNWVRFILLPPMFIFTMISVRFITNPVHAAGDLVTLGSAQAITHMRVFGVFTLGYAIGLAICFFSRSRLRSGLATVIFLMAVAIVIRAVGMVVDGTSFQQELRIFVPETVFLVLSLVGFSIETKSNKQIKGGSNEYE
jgi:hypothetical protein